MLPLIRNTRYLPRYRRIAAALTRHGLGWLADQAGLTRFLSWPRRLFRRGEPMQPLPSLAQRLCQALEELGPSFVVLGRYLSTRADLLPIELCQELGCLPEHGPAVSSEEVALLLEKELGRPIAELYTWFEEEPARVTWLEQLHRARTPQGRDLFVSLPNTTVQSALERDRPLFQELARQADANRPPSANWRAEEILQDFTDALRQHFDARGRGHNAEHWAQALAMDGKRSHPGDSIPDSGEATAGEQTDVLLPAVDWERTSARVLSFEALPARPLREVAAPPRRHHTDPADPEALFREELARTFYRFLGQAVYTIGLYPAPLALDGLAFLPDGRLTLLSFAPTGHFDRTLRRATLHIVEEFQREEPDKIIEAAIQLGLLERRQLSAAVRQAVRHMVDRYAGLAADELSFSELAGDLFALAGRGLIALPDEVALLLNTLVAAEEVGGRLAPRPSPAEEMAGLVEAALREHHSWKSREEGLIRGARSWVEAVRTLPADMNHLLNQTLEGDLLVGVEPRGWQKPMRRLDRMIHRLAIGVIAAGLLIALALFASAVIPASWGAWRWLLAGPPIAALLVLSFILLFSRR